MKEIVVDVIKDFILYMSGAIYGMTFFVIPLLILLHFDLSVLWVFFSFGIGIMMACPFAFLVENKLHDHLKKHDYLK